ncbi:hypothetical protein HDU98_004371 [Podochytrium sp. JEL0797]|nr:hypothetical protein HDU98_004371 [Podochytrium sp. JEL0797]
MSKSASKKKDAAEAPPSCAEFLTPPPSLQQVQQKVATKRAAILTQQVGSPTFVSLKGADALVISEEWGIDLIRCVKEGDTEEALSTIRSWFDLRSPLNPPQSLLRFPSPDPTDLAAYNDSEIEDAIARDSATAEYYYDALAEAYKWGYDVAQCLHWLTLFAKTHVEYIGLLSCSIFPWDCFASTKPHLFSLVESKRMIEYFVNTYMKHIRLITHFFVRPREISRTVEHREIYAFEAPGPLSAGIPEEKWGEYLVAEAERVRKLKEAEQAAIQNAKREAEEKERKRNEGVVVAEMIRARRQKMIITVPPLEPFTSPEPAEVIPDTIFQTVPQDSPQASVLPFIKRVYHPAEQASIGLVPPEPTQPQSITLKPPAPAAPTTGSARTSSSLPPPVIATTPSPVKITTETPLNPSNLAFILQANATPLFSHLASHLEKKMDHTMTEVGNRLVKVYADRMALRKVDREEDEKVQAWVQLQAVNAAAANAAAAASEVVATIEVPGLKGKSRPGSVMGGSQERGASARGGSAGKKLASPAKKK